MFIRFLVGDVAVFIALCFIVWSSPVHAADKSDQPQLQRLGSAKSWSAYLDSTKSGKICYLTGTPLKSAPAVPKRGTVAASVTHRSADKAFNVVDLDVGTALKEGSDAEIAIDDHKFKLFTNKDSAWARDSDTDKSIVDAMAKGKQAIVKASSKDGVSISDTYSLAGFTDMLSEIDKACGVKRGS